MPHTILVVDDDDHIRQIIRFALDKAGYQVIEAENGAQALELFNANTIDLMVLDIMMPEMDGTQVCQKIRQSSRVPIIFVTSKDEEIDRILGLELGGDDYVTKPFSPRELVARVKAVLRRLTEPKEESDQEFLQAGRARLDLHRFKAFWQDKEIVLTVTEFNLLRTLMNRPGKVFTRDELMDGAYDVNRLVSDRTIDSHVRRVRGKFSAVGADPIETVHGLGYKFTES